MMAPREMAMVSNSAESVAGTVGIDQCGLDSPRARQLLDAARAMGPALRERAERWGLAGCRRRRR